MLFADIAKEWGDGVFLVTDYVVWLNNNLKNTKHERHTLPVLLHPKTRHNVNAEI